MSIDVHAHCQVMLNRANSARDATKQLLPSLESSWREYQSDVDDVYDVCGVMEALDEDASEIWDNWWRNTIGDTLTTPKTYGDLLDLIAGRIIFGPLCLIELAGALQSRSRWKRIADNVEKLREAEDKADTNYINCLRRAGFIKARRDS